MANWFECKVRYDKMMENGAVKKVNEPYLVDALSFTEAEARIIEERTPYISGDFSVSAVKRTKIAEIFWNDDEAADRFYTLMLVQAGNFKEALDHFLDGMKGTMADFEIQSIAETPLLDVYKVSAMGGEKAADKQ